MSSDETAVFNNLRKLVREVRLSSHEVESKIGITGSQLFVLRQLAQHERVSLRELAALTLTDHSSVSVVVARLARRGFLTKKASPNDGRSVEISLTSKGRALLRNPPVIVQQRLQAALTKLPRKDLRTFRELLDRLVREVGIEGAPPEMFMEQLRKGTR